MVHPNILHYIFCVNYFTFQLIPNNKTQINILQLYKKYEVSKRPILGCKLKVKKLFSRGTLKEKEIKLGPHSGSPKG